MERGFCAQYYSAFCATWPLKIGLEREFIWIYYEKWALRNHTRATRVPIEARCINSRYFCRWNNPAEYRSATCHNLHRNDHAYSGLIPNARCRKTCNKLHGRHALYGGSYGAQSQPWHYLNRICYPWLTPLTIPACNLKVTLFLLLKQALIIQSQNNQIANNSDVKFIFQLTAVCSWCKQFFRHHSRWFLRH